MPLKSVSRVKPTNQPNPPLPMMFTIKNLGGGGFMKWKSVRSSDLCSTVTFEPRGVVQHQKRGVQLPVL